MGFLKNTGAQDDKVEIAASLKLLAMTTEGGCRIVHVYLLGEENFHVLKFWCEFSLVENDGFFERAGE